MHYFFFSGSVKIGIILRTPPIPNTHPSEGSRKAPENSHKVTLMQKKTKKPT